MPLPIWSASQRTRHSLDPTLQWIIGIILFPFNLEFEFLLMHESNFHVTGFSYWSNTHDVMRRVSRSRATFDVATTATSSWILAATTSSYIVAAIASRWILAATASSRSSSLEFQHSFPTFGQGYWPPPWAPLDRGQAPPWGMSSWTTPTPQLYQPSLPLMVRHLCLLSIVTFII
jgi:hypothetical protein